VKNSNVHSVPIVTIHIGWFIIKIILRVFFFPYIL